MRTLLLLRHAKSSWRHADRPDHDRPLNGRGKRDAPRMGQLVRAEGLAPDCLISSPARRARKTAARVRRAAGCAGEIVIDEDLYPGSVGALVGVIRRVPDEAAIAMLVGHNPGLEDFIAELCHAYSSMPTAAVARIELPIDRWEEIDRSVRGRLVEVWRPRDLTDTEATA